MNFKFLVVVVIIATIFFIVANVVPIQLKWIYELPYYGSLPWSYPWFVEPFMACLDKCGAEPARYIGFVLNAIILSLMVKASINKIKRN